MKKLLFSRESDCIQPLRELIEKQTHKALVCWALDCTPRFLELFEKDFPDDHRPRELITIAYSWAKGEVKMPIAKKAIHATHNAACDAEEFPVAQASARAIGHAAATIHVETHALGIVFYGLTALVYEHHPEDIDDFVLKECKWFYERLLYWEQHYHTITTWASFLQNENTPNKEACLRNKMDVKNASDKS